MCSKELSEPVIECITIKKKLTARADKNRKQSQKFQRQSISLRCAAGMLFKFVFEREQTSLPVHPTPKVLDMVAKPLKISVKGWNPSCWTTKTATACQRTALDCHHHHHASVMCGEETICKYSTSSRGWKLQEVTVRRNI